MLKLTSIDTIAFSDLADEHIMAMEAVFGNTYRKSSPGFHDGSFLNDIVDYRFLCGKSKEGKDRQLGRVFFAKKEGKVIGYLSILDDLHYEARPIDFLHDIKKGNLEDQDFIKSLVHLQNFAFVLHLTVLPEYEHNRVGQSLVDNMNQFYRSTSVIANRRNRQNIIVIATTIHQKQYRIFQFLKQAKEDYQFLDQQFSDRPLGDIRFRVAHILNKKEFFLRINKNNLHRTFDVVIPIQLNLAVQDVNSLIEREPFGARILWTSFFTHNQQLLQLSGMRKSYHGYYQALQHVTDQRQFGYVIRTLLKIAEYLKAKDNDVLGTPSLTKNLAKEGFEFFFINDDPSDFEFSSFANPLVFELDDDKGPEKWLAKKEFRHERLDQSKMDRFEWRKILRSYVLESYNKLGVSQKTKQEWGIWKWRLRIDGETEQKLLTAEVANQEGRQTESDNNFFNSILDRKIIKQETVDAWYEWLNLHRKLYKADFIPLKNSQDHWWCHAVIPITFTEGVSGVMFTFQCPKTTDLEKKRKLLNDLAVTISSSLSKNMLNIIGKLQQHVISVALDRYAMGAISVRNLSHNVGSHVLSHLSQEEILRNLLTSGRNLKKSGISKLSTLHSYLRVRMSLLADMATNDPVASVPAYLNQEVIEPFNEQKVLINYLTGHYISSLEIKYENRTSENNKENRDLLIQLPNGELGRSAFYIILVNILRNCVKHTPIAGNDPESINLVIRAEQPAKGSRGYLLTIFDETVRSRDVVEKMAKRFQNRYIEGELLMVNEIRNIGLGFAEMLVAAKYLRKRSFGHPWRTPERRIKFLEIRAVEADQSKGEDMAHLGFTIYVKKPRLLLIIDTKNQLEQSEDDRNLLSELGIKFRNKRQILATNSDIHSHAIAVDLDQIDTTKIEFPRLFPIRWINPKNENDIEDFKKSLDLMDREAIFYWAWKHWIHDLRHRVGTQSSTPFVFYKHLQHDGLPLGEIGIVFDSHGEGFRSGDLQHPNSYRFYEPFESLSPTKLPTDNWLKETDLAVKSSNRPLRRDRLGFELEEAAITRVVIIDERIQAIACELDTPSPAAKTYFEFLTYLNIYIPDPLIDREPNLNCPSFRDRGEKGFIDYLKPWVNGDADFVVLHIGLIEQIVGGENPQKIKNWLRKLRKKNNIHAEIVLISGRGKPQDLPKWVRFLPYNNIAKYILDKPAKYHLCRMLYGSRTRI